MSTYVAERRQLPNHCDFGSSLQQMLRDILVCGIEDPKIQRRLLAEPDLSFDKAFELALASESANQMPRIYKLPNHHRYRPIECKSSRHSRAITVEETTRLLTVYKDLQGATSVVRRAI